MGDDQWFDGYDMEEVLSLGDPSPSIVEGRVGSLSDGQTFASATALADSFGSAIFEPNTWPEGAGAPRYIHSAPSPFPEQQRRSYRIVADLPGHAATLLINGSYSPIPHWPGEQGWYQHPDLVEMNGLAQWDGLGAHVVVRLDGQSVYVAMFPSVDEAVASAKSLRRVEPGVGRE